MRNAIAPLALGLSAAAGLAQAQELSGDLTLWSWNVAASSLEEVAKGFMEQNPGVTVTVEDLGNGQVFDRMLASCAAGGADLPDIVTVENHESEIFWSQFPDCFADLKTLGYDDAAASRFPDFKRTELEPNGVAYAMPWDSGPVAMFYRRDYYEAAGVDPATIQTWEDFIAAGQKVQEANPDVVMTQGDLNGDTEWFRMVANEQGCGYFSNDAASITVNGPGCVAALDTIKQIYDAGLMTAANWDEKIQSNNAGTVATQMYGGW
jgi:lactose/L-arabinose transport system substrate-binding protein